MAKLIQSLLVTLLLGVSVSESFSQSATSSKDPAQWALIYSKNLEKNREQLTKYTWQFKVQVMEGSELLYIDLLEATRDANGKLITKRLEQDMKIKERHGLLSRAGQEKRLAEIEEKIEFIKGVLQSYIYMSRGEVVDFFDNAEVTEAVGYNNALKVDGEDVLKEGDYITLFGDKGTARPLFLTFSVPFNDKLGVDGSIEFRNLRNSNLFYGAQITANFVELKRPGKAKIISLEVESFDYQKK
ncbi:MAG: hypothetical protein P1U85_12015 [Verrucomicrobiales bacterium]|nr:hypothetical protein [Verrucomicrobiales bacterium]